MTQRHKIFAEIETERSEQDEKWGGPQHDDLHGVEDWSEYIYKHMERARELPDTRVHLVRVAALAVAAIESIDRKGAEEQATTEDTKPEPTYCHTLDQPPVEGCECARCRRDPVVAEAIRDADLRDDGKLAFAFRVAAHAAERQKVEAEIVAWLCSADASERDYVYAAEYGEAIGRGDHRAHKNPDGAIHDPE